MVEIPPIIQVGDVLLSSDILTEKFCCDLSACKGQCCVEGDAGAPVTLEEIAEIEDCLDEVWGDLSASAQAVIDKQSKAWPTPIRRVISSLASSVGRTAYLPIMMISMTSTPISLSTNVAYALWRRLSGQGRHASASPSVVRCIPSARNA